MPDLYLDDEQRLALDLDALIGSHLGIVANAGGGKSGLIRKLVEITAGRVQQIILDSEDEFYTLRQKHDFVIAGGDQGDCPATIANAGALATSALTSGFNLIVQLNDMGTDGAQEFVHEFLASMLSAPRELWHPCLIVIDETQRFDPVTIRMLTERGRKRGYTAILASQRLPKIDANIRGDINNWILGRVGQTLDRRIMADQLGMTQKEAQQMLTGIRPRHFWALGPALAQQPELFRAGEVQTTMVKPGQTKVVTPPPPEALREILAGLSIDNPAGGLDQREAMVASPPVNVHAEELERRYRASQDANADLRRTLDQWLTWGTAVNETLKEFDAAFSALATLIHEGPQIGSPVIGVDPGQKTGVCVVIPSRQQGKTAAIEAARIKATQEGTIPWVALPINRSVSKMVEEVEKWHPCRLPIERIAQLAGVSTKSSAWRNNRASLLACGRVELVNGFLKPTQEWIEERGLFGKDGYDPLQLLQAFREKLPPSTGRVIGLLAANPHQSFTRNQIAELAEISPTSSALPSALRELMRYELIEPAGDGYTAASFFRLGDLA